ncbi:MAG TPA: FGGY family carbohydrate kinase, partial [Clostridia bacterium]|nr:FGGY family carbohydrate kinase [Clostridia bacterium]
MNCTIGIDVGTSGCKAVLVDESTDIVASATRGYELIMPRPGWTEQRPEDWWNAAVECLKELSGALGGRRLAGIGLSGQMHGMVALDMDGRPVRPAILWNDQRTQTQCDEIVAAAGGLDALLAYTSNPMLTGFTAGKILWLKQNEPEHYAKTRRIVNPKDYIRLRLCGTLATDESDASGFGLFDVKERRWAYELIRKAGLDADMFPDVAESVAVTGEVSAAAAAATGIPAGTPVFGGGGDAVISTVGMGLALPGRVGVTLGTSGVVATGLEHYRTNPEGRLQLCCNVLPGAWHIFGCTLN